MKKIVLWNSGRNLTSMKIILSDAGNLFKSTTLAGKGRCRYEWTPPHLRHARYLRIETFPSSQLALDEVEVYGSYDRDDGIKA